MNPENGNSCPMPSCPDYYGTLPSCANLAVPYTAFQQNNPKKYAQRDALSNGTLFPGLNLPFHLAVEGSSLPNTPMVELQTLEFIVLELGLYLNTHPDDAEALDLFKKFTAMERTSRAEYEARFGPLTKDTAASGGSYNWLQDPWPWNFDENEVK